jgi:hypothetical protein
MIIDIIHIIVIIASFCVVSYQLHKNCIQMKSQNYLKIVKSHRDIWTLALDDKEFLSVFDAANTNDLSEKEKVFLRLLFIHLESFFELSRRDNVIPIEKTKFDIRDSFASERVKKFWESHRKYANEDFAKFVDEIVFPNY